MSADMLKRGAIMDVISDAGLLAVLIKEDRTISKELAGKMKRNFGCVTFPAKNVPSAVKYGNVIGLACRGEYIARERASEVQEFGEEAEKYRAIC